MLELIRKLLDEAFDGAFSDELIRTEEEDSLMVLRYEPSRELELTAPISCDTRSGDEW